MAILIVDRKAYAINVGDSRAILSKNHGAEKVDLSEDHRPDADVEETRIEGNGGYIYQTETVAKVPGPDGIIRE